MPVYGLVVGGLGAVGAITTDEKVKNHTIIAIIAIVTLVFLSYKRG